jgi:hypothetical protein
MKNKVKVLIVVDGGSITFVGANAEIEVVIVDYDNIEIGEEPIIEYGYQDNIFEDGQAFDSIDNFPLSQKEIEVRTKLKDIKF